MLTLAIATIVVLTVVSLALLFWPEDTPPPAPGETEAIARRDGDATAEGESPVGR